jgi:hypothetical protein
MSDPHAALKQSRIQAADLSTRIGREKLRKMLEKADREMNARLHTDSYLRGAGASSFTATQMKATLAHIRHITGGLAHQMQGLIIGQANTAVDHSVNATVDYLNQAERAFKGVGTQPLALKTAGMLDTVAQGVNASVLRRLASSGEDLPGADDEEHPGKEGILSRYGTATVENFEDTLQQGLIQRRSWGDVRGQLVEASPFLQGAPAHWAERIVRTETMGAANRANWETIREADEQLGDMAKILSATFDDRTGSDSYALHGQIRRPEEPFQTWEGFMQHPPGRPNDREVVVPHRVSWPIPPYLMWKTDAEVLKRWLWEGRKKALPPRPKMTTIPLDKFGK